MKTSLKVSSALSTALLLVADRVANAQLTPEMVPSACEDANQYFDSEDFQCRQCPSGAQSTQDSKSDGTPANSRV